MNKIEEKIKKILKKTFRISKIPKDFKSLKMGDLKKWDSLGNYQFLLAIEKEFNTRFETAVFTEIKSIKEIFRALKK